MNHDQLPSITEVRRLLAVSRKMHTIGAAPGKGWQLQCGHISKFEHQQYTVCEECETHYSTMLQLLEELYQ